MFIRLKHEPNPDIPGGYWSPELVEGLPQVRDLQVADLDHASKEFVLFTAAFDLGGGNCPSAYVYDEAGNKVARISYNGRIWTKQGDM